MGWVMVDDVVLMDPPPAVVTILGRSQAGNGIGND